VQTFLPYSRFDSTAAVLDDLRLGKQRVETLQILRALVYPSYRGWKNHPATAMWRGFTDALVAYGSAICAEWTRRGRADAVRPTLLEFTGGVDLGQDELALRGRLPPWLGLPDFHASHRSALVAKLPQHYRDQFPDADPDLPYVWPRPVFPRWPMRREAAIDEDDRWRVARAALAASGPTLWVHERPSEAAPPAGSLRVPVAERKPGTVAPSLARPPTDDDLASVADEISIPPLLYVHRLGDLRDPQVRAATPTPALVVLEADARPSHIKRMFPGVPVLTVPAAY
jgi:hypothetical protein